MEHLSSLLAYKVIAVLSWLVLLLRGVIALGSQEGLQ